MGNIFDILGPVMVGPSSSHTAGAVRIGMVARQLFGRQPERAEVYLHGSFAATGKGHGTDRALIAGLLGMMPDDMRIPDSYEVAKDMGMDFVMKNKNIKGAHPNTAQIIMEAEGVPQMKIQAHSIGGGRICVCKLDGIDVNFSGESCTLIIRNVDEPGRIMEVAAALSKAELRSSRETLRQVSRLVSSAIRSVRQPILLHSVQLLFRLVKTSCQCWNSVRKSYISSTAFMGTP